MRRRLKRVLIGLAVFIVLLTVAVWLWGDAAARKGVEIGGTQALGVKTTLDSASIGWLSGSVGIRGLKIANPAGYQTDRMIALGHGKVTCSILSLLGDEVVVRELLIEEPELTIELKPGLPPRSNLGDLLSSLKSPEEAAPAEKEQPRPAPEEGKKFRIDLLRVVRTKVRFHLLMGKTVDIVLPDIELRELRNSDGTLPVVGSVFRQVLVGMGASAFKGAKGLVPDDLLEGLGTAVASASRLVGGGLNALGEAGKAVGDTAGKAIGEATKAVGEVGKGVTGTIKGLFGKKEKKE
ncbi:MAG: hypothetical protein FJ291_14135 [Planctomycetes bacterium]|nr:hypothetical protein [Planctomycetota bacterium]